MFNVKYYKDYSHNYLVIKCEDECKENTYQRKMITANSIKGLLNCQERYINGDMLLYYEITSRQSLASIYLEKSMGWELLHKFFRQLKLVSELLQKYLLDESGLVLRPEYIFFNMDTEEFSFLYYPEVSDSSFMELMDFLTGRVDEDDVRAVEIVYKIADLIHREQFVLDEVLEWFQESEDRQAIRETSNHWQEQRISPSIENITNMDNQRIREDNEEAGEEEAKEEYPPDNKGKWAVLPAGAGTLAAGVLLYIMYNYNISGKGKILLAVGWSAAVVLLTGAAFWYIHQTYGKSKNNSMGQNDQKKSGKSGGQYAYNYVQPFEYDIPKQPAADCGNTVFIPWIDSCENRLHGMGKGNKYHIDLNDLPLTVGKMAGAVDMVLSDQSISRMHARFSRAGNKICITDLNSTNGTFKNGLRLSPNDSEFIEPGDEIRMGKLKFIYR